jgi:hypothetical protein
VARKRKGWEVEEADLGCLEVKGAQSRPITRVGDKVMNTTRLVYQECFGEIPEGRIVRHKCDNMYCINPEHLELGTIRDNMMDLVEKRKIKSRARHMPTDGEIRVAKLLIEDRGMTIFEAAKALGFPASSIKIGLENMR